MFVVSAKPSQWSRRGKVCHLNLILSSLGESFSWNPTPTCVNHHPCAGKYLDLPWAYRIWTPPPFSNQQKFQIVYFSSCTQRPVHISGSEMWNSICKSHRCLVWSVCVCVCVCAQSWRCSRLDTLPSRGSTADVGLVGRVWLLQTRYSGLHGHRLPQHLNGSLIIFSFVTYENMCFMYFFFYVLIDLIFFIPEITWSVFL